jgi:Zn-dependent M28 family amino/carboxypeptidase
MQLIHSANISADRGSPKLLQLLETIRPGQLRGWVEALAVPRHFTAEAEANQSRAAWLSSLFQSMGFGVERQGSFSNIVAIPRTRLEEVILVGAHYDSVPGCPGADDNASAVAAMLGCAAACAAWNTDLPIMFVGFNREEDDLLGSRDFVESYLPGAPFAVRCAHVLEMVGYASTAPGSQRVPTGLPIQLSDRGDFLGLLANGQSGPLLESIVRHGKSYVPNLAVIGLEVERGFERVFPVLARSDHVPFWAHDVPAVMWTDTAEFRNPHYHRPTDTPETLDYGFLRWVTQLLTAAVIAEASTTAG